MIELMLMAGAAVALGFCAGAYRLASRSPPAGILLATMLAAVGSYMLFEWRFTYGDGAFMGVIVFWAIGMTVGIVAFAIALASLLGIWVNARAQSAWTLIAFVPLAIVLFRYSAGENAPGGGMFGREQSKAAAKHSAQKRHQDGWNWAWQHSIERDEGCESSSVAGASNDPDFLRGCRDGIANRLRTRGLYWARELQLTKQEACDGSGGEGFVDHLAFIQGCKNEIKREHNDSGIAASVEHLMFAVEDCRAKFPQADPDFIAACEREVQRRTAVSLGSEWAWRHQVTDKRECAGLVTGEPAAEFVRGCEERAARR